jgi:hypothetical protein
METALAEAQTQLQQDHTTIEGVRSWQTQVEQEAQEAEKSKHWPAREGHITCYSGGVAPPGAERA